MKYDLVSTDVKWKDITPGGIMSAGTAAKFRTGDWRSQIPVWSSEKCKHCLLCAPVCPDASILVKDGKMSGIDEEHCKGCGLCCEACNFGALELVDEGGNK